LDQVSNRNAFIYTVANNNYTAANNNYTAVFQLFIHNNQYQSHSFFTATYTMATINTYAIQYYITAVKKRCLLSTFFRAIHN